MSRPNVIIASGAAAVTLLLLIVHAHVGGPASSVKPANIDLMAQINATVASALDTAILRARETASLPVAAAPAAALAAAPTLASSAVAAAPVQSLPASEKALREAQLRVNYSRIFMSPIETDLVLRHLVADNGGVGTYLEWGSGGSTTNFAQFARVRSFSIEHTNEWCKRMRPKIEAHPALKNLVYRCVPLPYPNTREGTYVEFRAYVDEIEKLEQATFDFVLVDGRARVSCAIKALSYITPTSKVVLHDSERIHGKATDAYSTYLPLMKYYDVVDSVGGKGRQGVFVMRRKKEFDYVQGNHATVQQLLNKENGVNA